MAAAAAAVAGGGASSLLPLMLFPKKARLQMNIERYKDTVQRPSFRRHLDNAKLSVRSRQRRYLLPVPQCYIPAVRSAVRRAVASSHFWGQTTKK